MDIPIISSFSSQKHFLHQLNRSASTFTHLNGKQIQKTVRRIGYIDEFLDKYPDPLAHFREEAKRLTLEEKENRQSLEFSLSEHFSFNGDFDKTSDPVPESLDSSRSYGVLPLLKIYRELELDYFLDIKRQYRKTGYNHNQIFQMLVFGRILSPDSMLGTDCSQMQTSLMMMSTGPLSSSPL